MFYRFKHLSWSLLVLKKGLSMQQEEGQ